MQTPSLMSKGHWRSKEIFQDDLNSDMVSIFRYSNLLEFR